jgi:hypothetical protein
MRTEYHEALDETPLILNRGHRQLPFLSVNDCYLRICAALLWFFQTCSRGHVVAPLGVTTNVREELCL